MRRQHPAGLRPAVHPGRVHYGPTPDGTLRTVTKTRRFRGAARTCGLRKCRNPHRFAPPAAAELASGPPARQDGTHPGVSFAAARNRARIFHGHRVLTDFFVVMSRPRLLVVGPSPAPLGEWLGERGDDAGGVGVEVVRPGGFEAGLRRLRDERFDGVLLCGPDAASPGCLIEPGGVLDQIPDGVVLLDADRSVLWANAAFRDLAAAAAVPDADAGADAAGDPVGRSFYDTLGGAEFIGPDFNPLNTAVALDRSVRTTLRLPGRGFTELHVRPVRPVEAAGDAEAPVPFSRFLAVIVRDVSAEVQQRQKLAAIYRAGLELGDLRPDELPEMSVEDRVELLKGKILQFSQDLLEFDTFEIRLLDADRERLTPLLTFGMGEGVAERVILASPTGNGVTGFVAATGRSYICEDTQTDPLYLPGAPGARSSLTVPLVRQDEVIGTLNVESDRVEAFDENDLAFVELFAREVAHAVNTRSTCSWRRRPAPPRSRPTAPCGRSPGRSTRSSTTPPGCWNGTSARTGRWPTGSGGCWPSPATSSR